MKETTDKSFDCAEGSHLIKICPEPSYFHIFSIVSQFLFTEEDLLTLDRLFGRLLRLLRRAITH